MMTVIVGIVAFTFFVGIMGIAFILKKNKKNNVSCSGACTACKHQY